MKLEDKNGFTFLEGKMVFTVDPEDIIWRMRSDWIGFIREGHNVFSETLLPYFETEAISRLKDEWSIPKDSQPDIKEGYEEWRMWWLNEASHNCDIHTPVGSAGDHLTAIGKAAVNILMTASALRHALEVGNTQEAAALSMLLMCEGMAGGYSIKFEAAQVTSARLEKARTDTYKKSIGAASEDHGRVSKACIEAAKKMWEEDPDKRIGEVAKELNRRILNKLELFPTLDLAPDPDTIKGWLNKASKAGKLIIPEAAQLPGRPKKRKN